MTWLKTFHFYWCLKKKILQFKDGLAAPQVQHSPLGFCRRHCFQGGRHHCQLTSYQPNSNITVYRINSRYVSVYLLYTSNNIPLHISCQVPVYYLNADFDYWNMLDWNRPDIDCLHTVNLPTKTRNADNDNDDFYKHCNSADKDEEGWQRNWCRWDQPCLCPSRWPFASSGHRYIGRFRYPN